MTTQRKNEILEKVMNSHIKVGELSQELQKKRLLLKDLNKTMIRKNPNLINKKMNVKLIGKYTRLIRKHKRNKYASPLWGLNKK
jgi:hypothetical protein